MNLQDFEDYELPDNRAIVIETVPAELDSFRQTIKRPRLRIFLFDEDDDTGVRMLHDIIEYSVDRHPNLMAWEVLRRYEVMLGVADKNVRPPEVKYVRHDRVDGLFHRDDFTNVHSITTVLQTIANRCALMQSFLLGYKDADGTIGKDVGGDLIDGWVAMGDMGHDDGPYYQHWW